VTLYFLNELNKKPKSRYRELTRSRDAWVKYFTVSLFECVWCETGGGLGMYGSKQQTPNAPRNPATLNHCHTGNL
jgi:hypothetical protein